MTLGPCGSDTHVLRARGHGRYTNLHAPSSLQLTGAPAREMLAVAMASPMTAQSKMRGQKKEAVSSFCQFAPVEPESFLVASSPSPWLRVTFATKTDYDTERQLVHKRAHAIAFL